MTHDSSPPPSLRLPEPFEQLLERWRDAPPSGDERADERQAAIVASLATRASGADPSLADPLAAPLPPLAGEPTALLAGAARRAGAGGSLKELARRALEEEAERTSSVHSLYRPRSAHVVAAHVIATHVIAADVIALPTAVTAPSAGRPATSTPSDADGEAAHDDARAAELLARGARARVSKAATRRAGWSALAAVAAAAALWVTIPRPGLDDVSSAPADLPAAEEGRGPVDTTPRVDARPEHAADHLPTEPHTLPTEAEQLSALPEVAASPSSPPARPSTAASLTTPPGHAEPQRAEPLRAEASRPGVEVADVVLEETDDSSAESHAKVTEPPTNPRGESLVDDEPRLRPAAEQTNLAQQPALGAIQGAFGSVMGSARACVLGHTQPSRATVTFGSDGKVRSVDVTGPARGTPAEGCIVRSVSAARVDPFARASFSAPMVIRP